MRFDRERMKQVGWRFQQRYRALEGRDEPLYACERCEDTGFLYRVVRPGLTAVTRCTCRLSVRVAAVRAELMRAEAKLRDTRAGTPEQQRAQVEVDAIRRDLEQLEARLDETGRRYAKGDLLRPSDAGKRETEAGYGRVMGREDHR